MARVYDVDITCVQDAPNIILPVRIHPVDVERCARLPELHQAHLTSRTCLQPKHLPLGERADDGRPLGLVVQRKRPERSAPLFIQMKLAIVDLLFMDREILQVKCAETELAACGVYQLKRRARAEQQVSGIPADEELGRMREEGSRPVPEAALPIAEGVEVERPPDRPGWAPWAVQRLRTSRDELLACGIPLLEELAKVLALEILKLLKAFRFRSRLDSPPQFSGQVDEQQAVRDKSILYRNG
eukprot:4958188-Prymnesium_polylepis.2